GRERSDVGAPRAVSRGIRRQERDAALLAGVPRAYPGLGDDDHVLPLAPKRELLVIQAGGGRGNGKRLQDGHVPLARPAPSHSLLAFVREGDGGELAAQDQQLPEGEAVGAADVARVEVVVEGPDRRVVGGGVLRRGLVGAQGVVEAEELLEREERGGGIR